MGIFVAAEGEEVSSGNARMICVVQHTDFWAFPLQAIDRPKNPRKYLVEYLQKEMARGMLFNSVYGFCETPMRWCYPINPKFRKGTECNAVCQFRLHSWLSV